jgi:putative ABC transport system permease protein
VPFGQRQRQLHETWLKDFERFFCETHPDLTSDQSADARERAADAGLTIETQRQGASRAKLSAIATAAGARALAILAMTVGLIRSETAGDLRTLTAAGATSRVRRTLTAATAGALAFLGALLGVAGAYVVVAATYLDDLGYLGRIPVLYLVVMSWAFHGRPLRPAGCSPAASRPPSPGPPSNNR